MDPKKKKTVTIYFSADMTALGLAGAGSPVEVHISAFLVCTSAAMSVWIHMEPYRIMYYPIINSTSDSGDIMR